MKTATGLLLIASFTALGQTTSTWTLNLKRFSADQIRQDGDVAHLHGNVVVRMSTETIYGEDVDYDTRHYTFATHGRTRVVFPHVRPNPGFKNPPLDPKIFTADEIRQDGDIVNLHGHVQIAMSGVAIYTEDASFNGATLTMTIQGDARLPLLKVCRDPWSGNYKQCEGDDLGPLIIDSPGAGSAK